MAQVFLDIDIGDAQQHAKEVAAYELAQQFVGKVGPQYGWPATLGELDGEAREMVQQTFAADPSWSAKGAIRLDAPTPLRAGRIVIELLDKESPKAAENFRALCTGEKGLGKSSRKPLHYRGCRFHRIVKGFVCQGGDFVKGDGSAGDSIYGGQFNDDKGGLKLKHDAAGVVGMANSGRKNTNTSQFYFTLAAAPQCDGKQVVFGKVVEGMDVLRRIDEEAATPDGTPRVDVVIAECGVL